MRKKSKDKTDEPDFKKLIPEANDEQIRDILKKRSHYQPEAAELAIQEAIKRGLIYSEQDLFAEEYKVEPLKFSLFPVIEDAGIRRKISRSICRALLFAGVIPVIYGVLRLKEQVYGEGSILIFVGLLWIFLSAWLMKKMQIRIVNLFFVLYLFSIIYVGTLLVKVGTFMVFDIFAFVAIFGFLLYGLLFLRRLNS